MDHEHDDVEDLRARLTKGMFRKTAFHGADALVAFVSQDDTRQAKVKEAIEEIGEARWFPVSGGWKVMCPYVGQEFDGQLFTIEEGGWGHTHCDICNGTISAGDWCGVSKGEEECDVICEDCLGALKG